MGKVTVVAAGGSLLYDGSMLNRQWLGELIVSVKQLVERGDSLGIVVGGGALARSGIEGARETGITDIHELDLIGIAATRLNAAAVKDAMQAEGVGVAGAIPESIEQAAGLLRQHAVVVMGGTVPGHTTDAVAIGLALAVGAEGCTIATNVDFIYDSNPTENPDAEPIPSLSLTELQSIVGGASHKGAGPNVVIDPVGVQLAIDGGLALSLLNGNDISNLAACLAGESFTGSVVGVGE